MYGHQDLSKQYSEDTEPGHKGKRYNQSLGEFICRLPYALTRDHTGHALLPTNKMQQCVCNVSAWGSLLKIQHPEILWGAGHTGTLCLVPTKIPVSLEESRCSTYAYYLYKQSRYSEPLLSIRESFISV